MHKHLERVREFHDKFGIVQALHTETTHLADIDIVMRQALLMECGSETCKALAIADNTQILAGLADLAYNALAAIACRGDDVQNVSVAWRQDGSILTVMRLVSEKIHLCSSGDTVHYSVLYTLCEQLARGFINADFDLAIQLLHEHIMTQASKSSSQPVEQHLQQEILATTPDLSTAFYE
ncbi:nucleoside triphosphate pyrophosphohydrolase family protein [Methylomonas sp. AM2-LC]|uniref:nucleoside triphosphate pyrophosphohydrolase family protein n=1 Tax=Methylomonas sp. AM2-LC TaxID=3153301 RepID=UPI003266D981